MDQKDVRIVKLPALRVAWVVGFGQSPEILALEKMNAWMKEHNLPASQTRLFGFDNPSPSAGSPNYGYEVWVTVEPEVEASGGIGIKTFEGGLYAVTRFSGNPELLPGAWAQLMAWVEASSYSPGRHQWLEEHLYQPVVLLEDIDKMVFDLYLPINR